MTFFVVLKRVLSALIALPQTYAIAAAYLLLSGIFFVNLVTSSEIADLSSYYSNVASTLIVLCPIVAMRSFAEERKSGALDLTLSWPVSRTGLVLGKYAANTIFIWTLVCVAWLYVRLLSAFAEVSVARAGGGFIGMLLLAAAFNALVLMVASRASSPTGSAFLGFGLLLFLWILDYAPTFIQNSLEDLGPTTHFEPFPRGVLYAEDVGYFLIVVVAGVALSVQALGRQSPGRAVGSLVRRSATIVAAVVVIGLSLSVSQSLDGSIDLTSDNRNTVTEATEKVLGRIAGDRVELIAFVAPISPEAAQMRTIVRQYRAAGANIRAEIIDPDVQPGKARALGIRDYKQYRLEPNGRFEVMDTLEQVPLTSAINRLSRKDKPIACFITGHGERSLTDAGPGGLKTLGNEVRAGGYQTASLTLDPATGAANLDRCALAALMGPTTLLPDADVKILDDFAKDDGRMVVMVDGLAPPEVRLQLNRMLEPWSIGLGDGLIRDKSALATDAASLVSFDYPSGSPVTARNSADNLPIVMRNTVPVDQRLDKDEDKGHVTNLVRSSRESVAEVAAGDPDEGPFSVGAVADFGRVVGEDAQNPDNISALRSARTRIGVAGSVDMASNQWIGTLGNRDFSTGLVHWVGREDDIISASGRSAGLYRVTITKNQKNTLIRKGIMLPTLAVLVPVPVALYRLKRGMRRQYVVIAVAALLAVIALAWPDGGSRAADVAHVVDLTPEQVAAIVVESGEGRAQLANRGDSDWVAQKGTASITQTIMFEAETRLFPLLGYRRVPVADPDLAAYGLDKPEIVLSIKARSGQVSKVAYGDPSFNTGGFYARRLDAKSVYLVPRRTMDDLRSLIAGKRIDTENIVDEKLREGLDAETAKDTGQPDDSSWLKQALDIEEAKP